LFYLIFVKNLTEFITCYMRFYTI